MKKIFSVTICLILILSNFIFIYARESTDEFENINDNFSQEITNSMVLELDRLNFYNPIKLTHEYDDFYSFEIFDLLFNYGNANLIINEINADNVIVDCLIDSNYDSSLVKLESNKKYVYDITIVQDEMIVMSFYGEIITGMNSSDLINCELLKCNDNTVSQYNVGTLAIAKETESNNTALAANIIDNDRDVYGEISTVTDVDYYKIKFTNSGRANFWLGNISSGSNLDLYVYDRNNTLLYSSKNSSNSQELINNKVVVGDRDGETWYYLKVIAANSTVSTPATYQINAKFFEVADWPAIKKQINYCYACDEYEVYLNGKKLVHRGIDVAKQAYNQDNIYAILDGTVTKVGFDTVSGYYVILRHSGDYPLYDNSSVYITSRYYHLYAQSNLSEGQTVTRGQLIGKMGNTGTGSQGTHLHLEIAQHNVANLTDPLLGGTLIDPGKNFYPEVVCYEGCGEYPQVLSTKMMTEELDVKSYIGILINNEYFISGASFSDMSVEELKRYGIIEKDLLELIEIMKNNNVLNYIDDINNLIYNY